MKHDAELFFKAINILCPNGGAGYDGVNIIPFSDPVPTQSEIDTQVAILKAEYDALEYARNRKSEYPNWGSQLNKIYDDGVTKWKSEMVDPVKVKWPKDNSGPV